MSKAWNRISTPPSGARWARPGWKLTKGMACWQNSLESQKGKAGIFQRILWNILRKNKKDEVGIPCSFKSMHANYTV